jgi:hypothetical protein
VRHEHAAGRGRTVPGHAPALGFNLTTQGRQLMSFIEFCEARGAGHITTELALAWAMQT